MTAVNRLPSIGSSHSRIGRSAVTTVLSSAATVAMSASA
jgi:hypothetical protein